MSAFASPNAYKEFRDVVLQEFRYLRSADSDRFLQAIETSCESRKIEIPKETALWRAQLGCNRVYHPAIGDEYDDPYPPERMKPLPCSGSEGRANPKGIPALYVASDAETAMREVRPWLRTPISLARLTNPAPLVIVNCANEERAPSSPWRFSEPARSEWEQHVWDDIDDAFAWPVDRSEQHADYAPTQILAEVFRRSGAAGIGYRSALGTGLNVALFELASAEIVTCEVRWAEEIKFSFRTEYNTTVVHRGPGSNGPV